MGSRRPPLAALGILLLLAAITVALLRGDLPGVRHAYLIPALWAALRYGRAGGALVSLVAVLLYAPLVFPAVEQGLTRESLELLLFLAWLGGVGPLVGALVSEAWARGRRYDTLLALQQALARDLPLDRLLDDVAERVRVSLRAHAVSLVVGVDGADPLVSRREGRNPPGIASRLEAGSAAAWVWSQGRQLFISDLESDVRVGGDGLAPARPRRAFLVPLQGHGDPVGVMVVERIGELPRSERAAIETLGIQLALGIENARLARRQRRFAEELEAKVAAATQRLRELDRAKSDFVSIVSHELRTPLTSIQGFGELLLNRPVTPERQRQFLGYILQEAERLGRIVEDLLDLSRIEAGKGRPLSLSPLDLMPLLDVNAELFGCQSLRHVIRVEAASGLPPVLADRDAVDRVLKNLLSNAIKYSPGGGPVLVRATRSAADPGLVEVLVEDRGVGIPPQALDRIFEKYYRISNPEAPKARGLGLGLALVKALVEAHGGTVGVTSRLGQGSCFTVALPVA